MKGSDGQPFSRKALICLCCFCLQNTKRPQGRQRQKRQIQFVIRNF